MEIRLRCKVPDRPGALAAVAGAIGDAGGDIQAVEVVQANSDHAIDELIVVISDGGLTRLVDALQRLPGIELLHAGPSRGHPGDAVTRLAAGLHAMLDGAMTPADTLTTLIGGLLHADSVAFVAEPPRADAKTLVLDCGAGSLVVTRDDRFTDTEHDRARALVGLWRAAGGRP